MTINLTGNEAVSYSANAGGLVLGENVVPLTFGNNEIFIIITGILIIPSGIQLIQL